MNARHSINPILDMLFTIIGRTAKISEETLITIRALLLELEVSAQLDRQQIAHCLRVQENFPTLRIPEEININSTNTSLQTLLDVAYNNSHENVFQELLNAKANPSITAREKPLLLCAARDGKENIIKLLIEAEVNPNALAFNNATALMCAAYSGHINIVKQLIAAKADLELMHGYSAWTALDWAIQEKKLEVIYTLVLHGAHIKFPEKLFDYLMTCDQRDPKILPIFNSLYQQLNNPTTEEKLTDKEVALIHKITLHFKKLTSLTAVQKTQATEAIDQATKKQFPKVLLNMISDFDEPLERISFFKSNKIDKLLTKTEQSTKKSWSVFNWLK